MVPFRTFYGSCLVSTRSREIYKKCPIPTGVEQEILSAENRAQRSHLWGTPEQDHDTHRTLHVAHGLAVAKALANPGVQAALTNLLPAKPPLLQLVHSCTHFSQSYAFNRFLVLLINAYYVGLGFPPMLLSCCHVVLAAAVPPHVCIPPGTIQPDPQRCFGHPHMVTLAADTHPNCVPIPPVPPGPLKAEVIIIRHGVTGPTPLVLASLPSVHHPRQLLPIHCSV